MKNGLHNKEKSKIFMKIEMHQTIVSCYFQQFFWCHTVTIAFSSLLLIAVLTARSLQELHMIMPSCCSVFGDGGVDHSVLRLPSFFLPVSAIGNGRKEQHLYKEAT